MNYVEPLAFVALSVAFIANNFLTKHSIYEFIQDIIAAVESAGIRITRTEINNLLHYSKIIDKGLELQKIRLASNHPDRHITGTLYKPEIEYIATTLQIIRRRGKLAGSGKLLTIDKKIKEFDQRVYPLTSSMLL